MSNWYYVQGTERMGPIDEKELYRLFSVEVIKSDSYVWRKGFENWERLFTVSELSYFVKNQDQLEPKRQSPEIQFSFDWKNFNHNDEIFFIKTGKDRHLADEKILGPYSLVELYGAFLQKRINVNTYIFTPGILNWEYIGSIPVLQQEWKIDEYVTSAPLGIEPGVITFERQPVPVISIIKKVTDDTLTFLCGLHIMEGDVLSASLYRGKELKVREVVLKVTKVNHFNQTIDCDFSEVNAELKKMIYEFAK
jgi:hypothetical protein